MTLVQIKTHMKKHKWIYLLVLFCMIIFGILVYRNKEVAFGTLIAIILIHTVKFYFTSKKC